MSWTSTHNKDLERTDYDFPNGFKVIHDKKRHKVYTECFGISVKSMPPEDDSMTINEFHEKLIGISKI